MPAQLSMSIEPGEGMCSRTPSQVSLPDVSSVYPLRRNVAMDSAEQKSARKHWQSTLKERIGSPGRPPGPEALPSLYERRGPAIPGSFVSKSMPPSSVGPSASIVAWFAQFQCEQCGTIPTSLEARFCSSCGQPLTLPVLPGAGGSGGSNVQATPPPRKSGGSPSAAAAGRGRSAALAAEGAPRGRSAEPAATAGKAVARTRSCVGLEGRGAGELERRGAARPPRPPGSQVSASEPNKAFSTRESKVAVWLGNVRPRRH